MFRFRYHYKGGPFDGHDEEVEQPGVEADLQRNDDRNGTWHHYTLVAPFPDFSKESEPFDLHYQHVCEFDPKSDYVEEVARRRAQGG